MLTDLGLDRCDAIGIAGLVHAGEVTPVEVVDAFLRRIEQANPDLRAFVHIDADAALARARDLPDAPLTGVPFAVKDLVGYPGMRWAMGSRLFAANVATEHSPYTRALDVYRAVGFEDSEEWRLAVRA
jgi:amidase